jgi:proline dehydrogenase
MISFSDTEIAFRYKSTAELKRACWLFKAVSRPGLVSLGNRLVHASLSIGLPIKGIIKATLFKQFVGGETIGECEKTIQTLHRYGVGTILDYSVEGKTGDEEFDSGMREIMGTIEKACHSGAIPFSVFKISGLAPLALLESVSKSDGPVENTEWEKAWKRVHTICRFAAEKGVPVFIDAEESWIQPAIDRLAEEMMERFNREKPIVYNTLQMYRHDRLAYLKNLAHTCGEKQIYCGVKIVRGAYMEKERARAAEMGYPDPIQPDKESTDRDFNEALSFCVKNIDKMAFCAGTHNEESCLFLAREMELAGLARQDSRICFAQLLGMSDHISFNLAEAGYRVAKYVPYGPVKELIPYLSRRAVENTSVKGQTGRELKLIENELKRRKQA